MELNKFISSTLAEIVQGVTNAQNDTKTQAGYATINPIGSIKAPNDKFLAARLNDGVPVIAVDFDVAIIATDEGNVSGGIKVFGTGADGKLAYSSKEFSRVKFSVPIILPIAKKT